MFSPHDENSLFEIEGGNFEIRVLIGGDWFEGEKERKKAKAKEKNNNDKMERLDKY